MHDEEGSSFRRKRGLSESKLLSLNSAILRLRPLLILVRLVDAFKQKWDGKRLGLLPT